MSREEWLDRYERRFVDVGVPPRIAKQQRNSESFEVLSEGYEDDPEGAADMEMSYWD